MSDRLQQLLAERPFLLADGATGTNLFAMGLMTGDAPELWNFEHPERIEALHRGMVEAGSDIILTNTFGGSSYRLKLHQKQDQVREINREAARIARRIADQAGRPVIVGGSIGPSGELFQPLGALTHAEASAAFAEQAAALAEGGVDLLWIETMSAREEVLAAVAGAVSTGLPFVATMSFDTNGRTMMGLGPAELAGLAHELSPRPLAYGANCGVGAAELVAAIVNMGPAIQPGDVVIAKGNCGVPYFVEGQIRYDGTPELMADYARLARDAGARIIGGCCGTTPTHIAAMRAALAAHVPGDRPGMNEIAQRLGKLTAGTEGGAVPAAEAAAAGGRRAGRRRRDAAF
jgi:5-methyltetrahydrofolate--homocysteine methyltransferase